MNSIIGSVGHLSVLTAFITALLSAFGYYQSQRFSLQNKPSELVGVWKKYARLNFILHFMAVIGIVGSLFYIIYNHLYQFHYAWSHSSKNLPVEYMISCFWEGQEGSFLLWIFWHALIGLILLRMAKSWESSVLCIFMLVQSFLVSMILGLVIGDWKIGSSPFILMNEAMDIPIFKTNPNFVPEDGRGLNPLLQNYWMVIHPPTLFLGFALCLVPFAYCMAGLWLSKFKEWVSAALVWSLIAAAVLGAGILMGAYWAYETLNFGGYWNWDPVENAVYIPWLVLVASIHCMIIFRRNDKALTTSIILIITTFILILYSTFLTRSGILGNASVHSFTDLGLSGQLLLYLLFFGVLAFTLFFYRFKQIPKTAQELSMYSREFWIFAGVTTLCLASFQVLATTSIPVYNAMIESAGFVSKLALPANQIEHYTKFQLWFAVFVAILSGTGQFFFWGRVEKESVWNILYLPFLLGLVVSLILIIFGVVENNWIFMILFTASIYSIIANSIILIRFIATKNFNLSGGAVTHIGIAMMFVGILFSSGFSKVISINNSGLLYSKEFSDDINKENVLLWVNKPIKVKDYTITYKGLMLDAKGFPEYIKKSVTRPSNSPLEVIANQDISFEGKSYAKRGDKIKIKAENTYYEVEYRQPNGKIFRLFPRAQVNPQMGLIASPDIKHNLGFDLYTHVSSIPDPSTEREWSKIEEKKIKLKDTLFLNDYVAIFESIEPLGAEEIKELGDQSISGAVKANLKILGEQKIYSLQPKFLIQGDQIGRVPDFSDELGLKITLMNIQPNEKEPTETQFTFGIQTGQKDYIIMKAVEKPLINILWIGSFLVMIGFGVAIYRRATEQKKAIRF